MALCFVLTLNLFIIFLSNELATQNTISAPVFTLEITCLKWILSAFPSCTSPKNILLSMLVPDISTFLTQPIPIFFSSSIFFYIKIHCFF